MIFDTRSICIILPVTQNKRNKHFLNIPWGRKKEKCPGEYLFSISIYERELHIWFYLFGLKSPNLCFSSCNCLKTWSNSGNADKSSSSRRSKASCFKQTDDYKRNYCNLVTICSKWTRKTIIKRITLTHYHFSIKKNKK